VILPNKANSSSSSRNKDTSVRCNYLFLEEASFRGAGLQPAISPWDARCLPGQRKHKVILPNKPNSSSSSRNKDTSICSDYLFSDDAQ
jgi:hypothetical protein